MSAVNHNYERFLIINTTMAESTEIPMCPVLTPTPEEFADFNAYIHHLDETYKAHHGMVKVIPPKGWRPHSYEQHPVLDELMIRHAIEQNVQGSGGYYESKNIVQQKMTFKAYKKNAIKQSQHVQSMDEDRKERTFWKTIQYSPPVYGADCTGSLMDETAGAWNMNKLDSLLSHAMDLPVKGVTTPYCYVGTWKAFFSWHKEDFDLSAMNYIHQGQPKVWYSIASQDGHILEEQAKRHFKSQYQQCPQFLRHKTFLINPYILKSKYPHIRITKNIHRQGQFTLVFGGAYHEGFNCGFNVAEAINYATKDWLSQMIGTQNCPCTKRSVKISKESILYNLQHSPLFEELLGRPEFTQLRQIVLQEQIEEGLFDQPEPDGEAIKPEPVEIQAEQEEPQLVVNEEAENQCDNLANTSQTFKGKPIHKDKQRRGQKAAAARSERAERRQATRVTMHL